MTELSLPDNSWHVFVRQQPEETYAPIRDQLRNLALIGVVMLCLLWAMGRECGLVNRVEEKTAEIPVKCGNWGVVRTPGHARQSCQTGIV
ncbi:MAG: hypothetical protein IPM88_20605 [Nitrospira sp.]|nr:hypothetical protein [Nitrospira sp.]